MTIPPITPDDYPVSRLTDDFTRVLVEPWTMLFMDGKNLYRIHLPEGTEYNPSIPGIGMALIPPSYLEIPSLAHDPLYRRQGVGVGSIVQIYNSDKDTWNPVLTVPRAFADDLFYTLMKKTGVPEWKQKIAKIGIFIGGLFAWSFD
jgi:hypothetical protein